MPLEKFRFFLEQDNFYLEEYARCLAMGAAKSRTEAELRYFTIDLNQVLDAELPSNRALLERVIEMGAADHGGSLAMAPANVAYTSYMQSLACAAGRSRSWRRSCRARGATWRSRPDLRRGPTSTHPVYGGWIEYFSLPANVEMVDGDAPRLRCARRRRGATRPAAGRDRADLRHELPSGTVVLGHGLHPGAVARSGLTGEARAGLDPSRPGHMVAPRDVIPEISDPPGGFVGGRTPLDTGSTAPNPATRTSASRSRRSERRSARSWRSRT